ncbi:hypothetical protein RJ641_007570 [Dillenia turbinata]|uniref:KIB1-4 beta-propeller domain-containing protein n=1 Tax=Dillenia turbinata TaxID=194707 RepID=A0AAN8V984_9MAGN
MFTVRRKIQKDKDVEPSEFEETIAQSLFDLDNTNQELKKPDMVEDYVVVAIYGDMKRLAFYQPSSEDTKWTYVDSNDAKLFADVICHEGKVYALDNYGRVVEINISNPYQPKLRKIIFSGFNWIWSQWGYIAELSSGDLVIARRSFRGKGEDRDRVSPKFKVWKLVFIPPNEEGERDQLVEVKDLGGDVIATLSSFI